MCMERDAALDDDLLSLLRQTSSVIFTTEAGGYAPNPSQWCALTGQSKADVESGNWVDALHAEDASRVTAAWNTALDHGTSYHTEFRVKCADGAFRWFAARAVPLTDSDGEIDRWVGMMQPLAGVVRHSSHGGRSSAHHEGQTITSSAFRAARALLNWSAEQLANEAGVSRSSIRRLETGGPVSAEQKTAASVIETLEKSGVEFTQKDRVIDGARLLSSGQLPDNVIPITRDKAS